MNKISAFIFCCLQTVLMASSGPTFKLMTPSNELAPGETVGVRFSSRMNDAPSNPPPIVVEPMVPYEFEWTSPSTGSIRFASGLDLGMRLRFRARPGLTDLAGQKIEMPPEIELERKTPDFGVLQSRVNGRHAANDDSTAAALDANASVRVTFNDDIKPEDLRAAGWFVSNDGARIAPGVVEKAPRHRFQERLLTWKEKASREPPAAVLVFVDGANDWVVSPGRLLEERKSWSFELDLNRVRGGVNPDSNPVPLWRIPMGDVLPLTVESVALSREPLKKARLSLKCSKAVLGEEMKRLSNLKSLITPPVEELNVYLTWKGIALEGDFQPGVNYRVFLESGLRAEDGCMLKQPFESEVQLDPLPPRLYFDRELVRQLSSGRRQVPLMAVKMPRARITAHLIPPEKGWDALRLWKQYQSQFHSDDPSLERDGVPVDPSAFEGQLIHEKTVEFDYSAREEAQLMLKWDEMLGKKTTGVVLLTAEEVHAGGKPLSEGGKRCGVQTLVQLTDIGLELFAGRGGPGFCFAYSLADATPLAKVKCAFYNARREKIGEVETGKEGTAEVPFRGAAWVEATLGNDQLTVLFDTNFWVPGEQSVDVAKLIAENEPAPRLEGFVFSDRDLYRPGEMFHAKVFIRRVRTGGFEIPKGTKFQAVLDGERGEQIYKEEFELGSSGAWTISTELPKRTGGYTLSISQKGSDFDLIHSVSVAEFQPDAFRISLDAPTAVQAPTKFEAQLSAIYLSGQPVNDAVVRWEMHESPTVFNASGYGPIVFGVDLESNVRQALWPTPPRHARSGEFKLDADGKAAFSSGIDSSPNPAGPRDMVFQTEITDLNNQTLSKSHQFVAHSSDF
ncbi:MAG: MG2 domain-containing protein, partial [Planctomycetaceae bacterium]